MHSGPDPGLFVFGAFFLFWLFAIGLGLAFTVFWIVELVDVARREFPDSNTKLVWILVVVLSHGVGALVYYFVGKRQGWLPGERPASYGGPPPGSWPPPPGG